MRRGALLAALAAAVVSCDRAPYEAPPPEVAGFLMTLADGSETGSPAAPLPFPSATPAQFTVKLVALDAAGNPFRSYSRRARIGVVPGELLGIDDRVAFENGEATVTLAFRFSFDETRIWIEDAGEHPATECDDTLDNDGDGLIDARDPDCLRGAEPVAGRRATLATGISAPLYFARPRIHDVQFSPRCTTDSPLGGQNVIVERGSLIVTGTTQSGLYVTDMSGPESGYNSIYLFTFSNPGDVRRGDRLCRIDGNAAEFIGNSQLNFPSYLNADLRRNGGLPCEVRDPARTGSDAVPPPKVLTAAHLLGDLEAVGAMVPDGDFYRHCGPNGRTLDIRDGTDCVAARNALDRDERRLSPLDCARDNFAMEPWEHALVAFEDVTLSNEFVDCDANGDGRIDFGGPEGDCADECNQRPLCTERINLDQFGQFAAAVGCRPRGDDTGELDCDAKFFLATRDTLGASGFDAMAHGGEHREVVIGHLRQIQPGPGVDTTWVVEPRFIEDINGQEIDRESAE